MKYQQKTKHRAKCRECGKLIQDGDQVRMERIQREKYYPVKGIMRFWVAYYWHEECYKG